MNCARTNRLPRCASRVAGRASSGGFTLVEVLAALLFMAIVIPVAVEGLRIASRAGLVAERKAVAARIADRLLNELLVTGQWQSGLSSGTLREGPNEYRWDLVVDPWELGVLQLLTLQVTYLVQNQEYEVRLSTLADNNATPEALPSSESSGSSGSSGSSSPSTPGRTAP